MPEGTLLLADDKDYYVSFTVFLTWKATGRTFWRFLTLIELWHFGVGRNRRHSKAILACRCAFLQYPPPYGPPFNPAGKYLNDSFRNGRVQEIE